MMMPPGFVAMPPPGMQRQPVYAAPPQQVPPVQRQPRELVRASAPEEKKPVKVVSLTLPPPEQLNIRPAVDPLALDWNATHARMKTMGVLSYQMERLTEGGWRYSVVMATAEAGRTYRIEGSGVNEADAVRICLDKTDRWLKQIP